MLHGDGRDQLGARPEEDDGEEDFVHIPWQSQQEQAAAQLAWKPQARFQRRSGVTFAYREQQGRSPTHEGLLNEGGSSDYESRLAGIGSGGETHETEAGS